MLQSALGIFTYYMLVIFVIALPFDAIAERETSVLQAEKKETSSNLTGQTLVDSNAEEDSLDDDYSESCSEKTINENNIEKSFFSYFDNTHESISSGVEFMAQKMDSFFSRSGDNYESSGSYLRIRQNIISREGGLVENLTDLRFKLRLPNTQKKLKLFVETKAEDDPNAVLTGDENAPTADVTEGDYLLALQADPSGKYGFKFKPRLGIHLGSNIDPYVRFRLSREDEFAKWKLKWNETLQWYDSIGWGVDSYLELSRKINDYDLFRSSTFASWKNQTDQFDISHVFSIFHAFNDKRALTYYAGAYGVSEPAVYATHYLLGMNYRQNVHKDYLFIELEPQVKYQKINNFHAEHSFTIRLEVLFKK